MIAVRAFRPAIVAAAAAVVSLGLPAPAPAAGQEAADPPQRAAPVTPGEAIRRVSEPHPSIRASEAGAEAARARLEGAEAARWPDLSVVGSATQYQRPMVVHPIHGFTPGALRRDVAPGRRAARLHAVR